MTNSILNNRKILELKNIHKSYVMGEVTVSVLNGIDLYIREELFTVILGASGSGKSTLMNLIGGIDTPSSGEIVLDGKNLAEFNEKELTLYRREQVGFVFQFYNLVPTLTALENVQVGTEISSDPMDPVEALNLVGLGDRIHHFPAQLSGGQQQRVAVARAVAKNPRLLLCDEPTGALDRKTGVKVLELLVSLNERFKTTIVIITHAAQIGQMGHMVLHLDSGKIVRTESCSEPRKVRDIVW